MSSFNNPPPPSFAAARLDDRVIFVTGCVHPGSAALRSSGSQPSGPDDAVRGRMAKAFPVNYIADLDDMARAALFLLSDESRWTTGTVLPCEGGFAAG